MIAYVATFTMSVFVSMVLLIMSMYMLLDNHLNDGPQEAQIWPQSIIMLIFGIWVSDRPKLLRRKAQNTFSTPEETEVSDDDDDDLLNYNTFPRTL